MKHISAILLAGVVAGPVPSAAGEMTTMVGGAPMYPSKNIVQNAVNSKDHTTLVAAVKAAGLVQTLESPGPFTVFAPTNDAFAKPPDGTVATVPATLERHHLASNRKLLPDVGITLACFSVGLPHVVSRGCHRDNRRI